MASTWYLEKIVLPNGTWLLSFGGPDPNGIVSAPMGSTCQTSVGLWTNLNGLTAWTNVTAANADVLLIPFTFTSGTLVLYPLTPGTVVRQAEIVVTTTFDDPAAMLSVGTPALPGVLVDTTDCDPGFVGRYGPDNDYKAAIVESLQLVVTPGASTQGAGYILFTLGG